MLVKPGSHFNEIMLFTNEEVSSHLSNYLNFLHMHNVKRPYNFSYICENGSMLPNLTIQENILLEAFPIDFSSRDTVLEKHIEKNANQPLKELFAKIELLDIYPKKASAETKKIASLVTGLIKDTKYLFFHRPETHLSEENIKLFRNALKEQHKINERAVFVHTQHQQHWHEFASKIVSKGEGKKYSITPILNQQLRESIAPVTTTTETETATKTEEKKAA